MMTLIVQAQHLPNRQRRVRVESCLGGRRLLAWQVLKAVLVMMKMRMMMRMMTRMMTMRMMRMMMSHL